MADQVVDAQRFDYIKGALEDSRRLIAAAKVQRWEVLKWAVALNAAVAGAAAINPSRFTAGWGCFAALSIAVVGWGLVLFLSLRARGARRDSAQFGRELGSSIVPNFVLEGDNLAASQRLSIHSIALPAMASSRPGVDAPTSAVAAFSAVHAP
jgi:hypothetical protein